MRRLRTKANCPICKEEDETVAHRFRYCKLTKQVLQELEVTLSNRNTENDWNKWLVTELGNKSSQLYVTTAVAFWAIWFSRNKFIHEGILSKAQEIASFVRNYTIEISQTEGITEFLQRNKNDTWRPRPPEGDQVKANFDASFQKLLKRATGGVIIRNNEGL
ncbi:hypothetical protein ES319_D13G114900v1 [Gossypium barbadense]|uniref:Reverse transcriptase zinc-binding domain-containing protein n=2 Tax=Gossypium TaxID=3633 RepID=A0A5J5NK58_GOSBA|nr:hypothetical protein ES319_D13G114900v1 [Gossypium barbadense]PPD98146.1 hypothetical protein GOBAR_DD04818 [Gossypium barbadense]TYG37190.1 hypothetical protein ES288_D13G121900v1 [Gossypium darwinii]